MPFRRKYPQHRPLSPSTILQREIEQIDHQDRRYNAELQDMLTDVATPTTSDQDTDTEDSALPPGTIFGPHTFQAAQLQADMLSATALPTEPVSYSCLYLETTYKRGALKKLKRMKKTIARLNFDTIDKTKMWKSINRVKRLYPKSGGRRNLAELIGLFCLFDTDNTNSDYVDSEDSDFDSSDYEDTSTSEDEPNDDHNPPNGMIMPNHHEIAAV